LEIIEPDLDKLLQEIGKKRYSELWNEKTSDRITEKSIEIYKV